jgi:CHAD domain-containing protein
MTPGRGGTQLKYAADDSFEIPALIEVLAGDGDGSPVVDVGPLSEGEVGRQRLDATYFDTADLRLARAGLTLRRQTGGENAGWHLQVEAGGTTRSEVRLPPGRVPPGRTPRVVPAPLQSMVWARTLGDRLQPVARITTERTVRRLTDATGRVLAEVADDRVSGRRLLLVDEAAEAAGAETSWREIEVVLGDGADGLGELMDARLRDRGLQETPAASMLVHVLGSDPTDSEAEVAPRPKPSSPAAAVLLAHLRQQVTQVQAQDLPVRLDTQDSVHKMRVATRRLRSALTTFKPLFDTSVTGPLRNELKWLAGELGAARDAEVMRERVSDAVEDASHQLALHAEGDARSELTEAYRAAHDRVLAELDGDRYRQILVALHGLVEEPPFRKRAGRRAGKVFPALVARSYDRVRGLVEEAESRPSGAERDELMHDARKAAKQARYAGEAVAPVFGKHATRFAAAMEDVQEALGEHQDSLLTRDRLRTLATHASSTDAAFVYGRLHALEEARTRESQQRFDSAWKAAGRSSLHRWLQ